MRIIAHAHKKLCSYSTLVLISLSYAVASAIAIIIATRSTHKINSRGYEKAIQIVLASSQALSPAPFQAKGGVSGHYLLTWKYHSFTVFQLACNQKYIIASLGVF